MSRPASKRAELEQFLRFCVVGFIGFVVDALLLEFFVRLGFLPHHARLLSIAGALQMTYILHRYFTFRIEGKKAPHSGRSWAMFMFSNLAGAALNYLTFLTVLTQFALDNPLLHRQAALLAGTVAALFFNYWANRRFVFTRRT